MLIRPNSVHLWLNVAFVCNSGSKALVNSYVKAKAAFSPNQQNSSPEPEGGAGSGAKKAPQGREEDMSFNIASHLSPSSIPDLENPFTHFSFVCTFIHSLTQQRVTEHPLSVLTVQRTDRKPGPLERRWMVSG